jgi:hypothetical protein
MGKTDLMPLFVTLYQHAVSRELMQEVLDTYHRWGAVLFKISPAALRLGAAQAAVSDDQNKRTLANTLEITERVYTIRKPGSGRQVSPRYRNNLGTSRAPCTTRRTRSGSEFAWYAME